MLRLARFVNGSPFKPEDFGESGSPVVRIRQLLDPSADLELAATPARPVWIMDGDLVFSWSATLAIRTWARGRALLNQHLFRVDVKPGIEQRWLGYVLEEAVQRLGPLMHGSAMTHITLDMLRDVRVHVPSPRAQRAIADYLDAETAHIDALIEKKRRMVELLEERQRQRISVLLWNDAYRRTRLKNVVGRPTSGNRDHSSFSLTDDGVPCLRGLNVRNGRIDRADLRCITHGEHLRHASSELHAGDVVVVRSGLAGSAAMVPGDLDGCNCVDLVIVRRSNSLDPRFLVYVLNSNEAQDEIRQRTSGALLTHFNADQCGDLSIPYPPRVEQRRLAAELDRDGGRVSCLVDLLELQVGKLVERRHALITAAVTGELPIPGVAA